LLDVGVALRAEFLALDDGSRARQDEGVRGDARHRQRRQLAGLDRRGSSLGQGHLAGGQEEYEVRAHGFGWRSPKVEIQSQQSNLKMSLNLISIASGRGKG
jgi:hypothetical protein